MASSCSRPLRRAPSRHLPPRQPSNLTEAQLQRIIDIIIRDHHLDQPYPVQYGYWISGLLQGDWGWSPKFRASGAGGHPAPRPSHRRDHALFGAAADPARPTERRHRWLAARTANRQLVSGRRLHRHLGAALHSGPGAALHLLRGRGWFSPGRTDAKDVIVQSSTKFDWITGLLTVDGLLNGRPDITLNPKRSSTWRCRW